LAAPSATTAFLFLTAEAVGFPAMTTAPPFGIVYLVGAGPGDPIWRANPFTYISLNSTSR